MIFVYSVDNISKNTIIKPSYKRTDKTIELMQNLKAFSFACAAESSDPASYNMSAFDAYSAKTMTAIITMMAVVLYTVIRHLIVPDVIISIIIGAIILVIVRKKAEPVSRT